MTSLLCFYRQERCSTSETDLSLTSSPLGGRYWLVLMLFVKTCACEPLCLSVYGLMMWIEGKYKSNTKCG
jgi:hypothetical protein